MTPISWSSAPLTRFILGGATWPGSGRVPPLPWRIFSPEHAIKLTVGCIFDHTQTSHFSTQIVACVCAKVRLMSCCILPRSHGYSNRLVMPLWRTRRPHTMANRRKHARASRNKRATRKKQILKSTAPWFSIMSNEYVIWRCM